MVSRSLARVYVLLIAHHLGAAGDDAILHARPDGRGGQADRRDPAAAEPVERRAAGGHGIARRQRRHAAEVAALPAFLCRSRPDDVIDRRGVERVAIANRREHGRAKMLRVKVRKRALSRLADAARGAGRVDNQGFAHVVPPAPHPSTRRGSRFSIKAATASGWSWVWWASAWNAAESSSSGASFMSCPSRSSRLARRVACPGLAAICPATSMARPISRSPGTTSVTSP